VANFVKQQIDVARSGSLTRIVAALSALSKDTPLRVTIEEAKSRRSDQQNKYLWGVCYATLLKHLPGWDAQDIHEYFLGEHFGWETLEGMGKRRLKPLHRSSKLSTTEFAGFVDFIQRKAAELGVVIPDPT
jgi:hypothetical protein